jgi:hypothetical protein
MADPWAGFKVVTDDAEDPWASFKQVDMGASSQPAATEPTKPTYNSMGEAAVGAAKALGSGLVRGAVGFSTLPGNVEALGSAGINKLAGMAGVGPVVNNETLFPTYNDFMGRLENTVGPLYKPQTKAEQYISTIGEFAPAAIGGGASLGAKAAQVAAPALLSETAGQLTKGTAAEPYARVAGGMLGGVATNVGARAVTPSGKVDSIRTRNVAELERQGVDSLLAGQKTGHKMTRALEDASVTMPGGGRTTAIQDKGMEQFTERALKNIGVDKPVYQQFGLEGARATDEVLEYAANQIGKRFENVAKAARVLPDNQLKAGLTKAVRDYSLKTSQGDRVPAIQAYANEIISEASKSGGMEGAKYLAIRSALRADQRSGDGKLSRAASELVDQLDAAMIRAAPRNLRPQVSKYIQDNNRQWRDFLAIRETMKRQGEVSSAGLISPQVLNQEIKKQSKNLVSRNTRELGKLARAGDDVMRPLKSSGTAERNQAISVLKGPSTALSAIGGALASGGDPFTTVVAGLTPLALQAGTARFASNPTLQKYLANQLMTGRIQTDGARRASMGAMTPFLLTRDDLNEPDAVALGRLLATQR